jgi:hypothetical protein
MKHAAEHAADAGDKKKKRKNKELKLERDDDDISLFLVADKVEIEALVEQELAKWDISDEWKQRLVAKNGILARRVGSKLFRGTVNLVILFNVIVIAIQGEHSVARAHDGMKPSAIFLLVDTIFCGIFFTEILLRILAERIVFFIGPESKSNIMDMAFVICDVVNQLFMFVMQGVDISYVGSLRTGMKMIRLARAARALRMFRIVRSSTRCRLLIEETVSSMSLGFWLCLALWVVLTFFGIFFMQAAADSLLDEDKYSDRLREDLIRDFGSSPEAVFTLFKVSTGGMHWNAMFNTLLQVDSVYGIVFIAFVIFTLLLFLNVVTGVFIDSALKRSKMHEVENKSDEADTIKDMLRKAELENTDGLVSKEEFLAFLATPYGKEQLTMLGLENAEALGIYELLDKNGCHKLDIDELASGCSRFTQPMRCADHIALLLAVRKMTKEQRVFADYVVNRFSDMIQMVELTMNA